MKVIDASVLVQALADDEEPGAQARRALDGVDRIAPAVIDLEVVSALRGLARAGRLDPVRSSQAVRDLADDPLLRLAHDPLLGRIWELRDNLSAYDGAYVALAELTDVPLLTRDRAIALAPGVRCEIQLLA